MIEDLEDNSRRAFNIVAHDSILLLQFSERLIPGACQIKISEECDMSTAILNAYNEIMDEYPPDNRKIALILGGGAVQAEKAASVLIGEEYCKKVLVLSYEEAFLRQYSFLVGVKMADFPNYPSEITDSLYLGGIGNLNQDALSHLGMFIKWCVNITFTNALIFQVFLLWSVQFSTLFSRRRVSHLTLLSHWKTNATPTSLNFLKTQ